MLNHSSLSQTVLSEILKPIDSMNPGLSMFDNLRTESQDGCSLNCKSAKQKPAKNEPEATTTI